MGRAVIRSGTLRTDPNVQLELAGPSKIHYGCAEKLFANWINVDFRPFRKVGFTSYKINLVDRHPFPDSSFSFGYSQDFIEHLQQSDQICFLTELFRTFRMDATIRLSFPGLEGVLKECYTDSSVVTAFKAKQEAFEQLGHLHFLSREELTLICKHLGFRKIKFVNYGESEFAELCGLDDRIDQIDCNTCVEITK